MVECRSLVFTSAAKPEPDPDPLAAPYSYGDEHYIEVARNLGNGELALDKDFRIAYADEGFLKIVGFTKEELIGQDLSLLLPPSMSERRHQREVKKGFPECKGYYVIFVSANQLPLPPAKQDEKRDYQVFISYRRKSSAEFTKRIVSFLLEKGYDVWYDINDVPIATPDFQKVLEKGIIRSDRFMFFLTEEWLESEYCDSEIRSAIKFNKPILPIIQSADPKVIENFHQKYPELKNLDFRLFRPGLDSSQTGFAQIETFLNADQNYLRRCNEYLVKAVEWEKSNRKDHFLLTGPEARLASFWLESSQYMMSGISDLHKRFIGESNARYMRRQRMLPLFLGGVCLASIVTAGSIGALYFRQEAILRQSRRDQIAATIASYRGDSNWVLTIREVQPCKALESAVIALAEADEALDLYFQEFGTATDLAEKAFEDDLMQKVRFIRTNLRDILGDMAASPNNDALLESALSELSRRVAAQRCEPSFVLQLEPDFP